MKLRKFGPSVALLAILSACSATDSTGVSSMVNPSAGAGTVAKTSSARLDVSKAKAFAGVKDVYIGGFKVGFVTERKGSSANRGSFLGGGGGMARASANTVLEGVSPQLMQEITDVIYADFQARLAASGYSVRPFSELLANESFRKVNTKPSPFETGKPLPILTNANALIFAPSGQKLRLFAAQGAGVQGFGWSSPEAGFSAAAAKTGTPIIDVDYVVTFSYFDGYSGRSSASISAGQAISVHRGSMLNLTKGEGGTFSNNQGSIAFASEITSGQQFATVEKEGKSSVEVAGEALAVGAAVLLGGGTRTRNTYVYRADPAKYKSAVVDSLVHANATLASKMASLR
jgi:hypothetical protein